MLHPNASLFARDQVFNGYTMRGKDIQAAELENLSLGVTGIINGANTTNFLNPGTLKAWWPCIGTTSTSQALNMISNTLSTFPVNWTLSPTAHDGYMTFNGTSQYGAIANSNGASAPPFSNTGAITLSVWATVASFANAVAQFCGRWTDLGYAYTILRIGSAVYGLIGIAGSSNYGCSVAYSALNTWSHWVMTFIPSVGVFLYKDGTLAASNTVSPPAAQTNSSVNFQIGAAINGATPVYFHNGSLSDVMMFNVALTSTQVANLYTAQFAIQHQKGLF